MQIEGLSKEKTTDKKAVILLNPKLDKDMFSAFKKQLADYWSSRFSFEDGDIGITAQHVGKMTPEVLEAVRGSLEKVVRKTTEKRNQKQREYDATLKGFGEHLKLDYK